MSDWDYIELFITICMKFPRPQSAISYFSAVSFTVPEITTSISKLCNPL